MGNTRDHRHRNDSPAPQERSMAVEHLPAISDNNLAGLLAAAEKLVAAGGSGMPPAFAAALFQRAVAEDLVRYRAAELAALAEAAWAFLAERKPGAPKLRIAEPDAAAGGERLKQISVLEIVNDDMPFLVDSVMGELSEQGVDIHLVVHPVFPVARDDAGRLTGFGAAAGGAAQRESFIHIHIERIEDAARRSALIGAIEKVLADVRVSVHDWR